MSDLQGSETVFQVNPRVIKRAASNRKLSHVTPGRFFGPRPVRQRAAQRLPGGIEQHPVPGDYLNAADSPGRAARVGDEQLVAEMLASVGREDRWRLGDEDLGEDGQSLSKR